MVTTTSTFFPFTQNPFTTQISLITYSVNPCFVPFQDVILELFLSDFPGLRIPLWAACPQLHFLGRSSVQLGLLDWVFLPSRGPPRRHSLLLMASPIHYPPYPYPHSQQGQHDEPYSFLHKWARDWALQELPRPPRTKSLLMSLRWVRVVVLLERIPHKNDGMSTIQDYKILSVFRHVI